MVDTVLLRLAGARFSRAGHWISSRFGGKAASSAIWSRIL
jgi:hypothetical protein